jgi:hypothetical protein
MSLWPIAVLWRCRFTTLRLSWLIARFGTPPHCLPLCSGQAVSGSKLAHWRLKEPRSWLTMSHLGHERPGRAGSGSEHVRFAAKATVGHENAIRR